MIRTCGWLLSKAVSNVVPDLGAPAMKTGVAPFANGICPIGMKSDLLLAAQILVDRDRTVDVAEVAHDTVVQNHRFGALAPHKR